MSKRHSTHALPSSRCRDPLPPPPDTTQHQHVPSTHFFLTRCQTTNHRHFIFTGKTLPARGQFRFTSAQHQLKPEGTRILVKVVTPPQLHEFDIDNDNTNHQPPSYHSRVRGQYPRRVAAFRVTKAATPCPVQTTVYKQVSTTQRKNPAISPTSANHILDVSPSPPKLSATPGSKMPAPSVLDSVVELSPWIRLCNACVGSEEP